jgi:DNA polymerase V
MKIHKLEARGGRTSVLPLFSSTVPAGFASPSEDDVEENLDLNELLLSHPAATFFVRVEGSSMEGANIFSGDILIVDRALEPSDGKIVLAILDGAFTVKRIRMKGKKIFLAAENPAFPPLEIAPEREFQVWGVVTYIIHKAL